MSLPFIWVDAFTTEVFGGNPCSVVFDAGKLSSKKMLKIAKEFNLSETAFVTHVDGNWVTARYFTPAEEIPMAGHPTISTIYALWKSQRLPKNCKVVELDLPAGRFEVEIREDGSIAMTQQRPQFLRKYDRKLVGNAFSLDEKDILKGMEPQTVSTGTPQLMVPVVSLSALKQAHLRVDEYLKIKKDGDFFSPHLFCLEGATEKGSTFARHFGIPPDTFEDSFTGSATGGMASYIWHHGLLTAEKFTAEQGHWMKRPGQAEIELIGSTGDIQAVQVRGRAVIIMSGTLLYTAAHK